MILKMPIAKRLASVKSMTDFKFIADPITIAKQNISLKISSDICVSPKR